MSARAYLFLQGVCSPLFRHLARALRSAHCPVLKVNFNAGDLAYWGISGSRRYTGRLPALEAFLTDLLRRHDITDILLFGDCRPVHKPAVALAAQLGLRCHVLEEGYFRPYWFTLERGGVNRHSALPRDPHWYRAVAASLPPAPPPQTFQQPFAVRALHDFAYHAASMLNPLAFPHYRTHAEWPAPLEYAGYVRRALRLHTRQSFDTTQITALLNARALFYLLPLQLSNDSQIKEHSAFADMRDVLSTVMSSFARAAPPQAHLVIKNHPLDYRWHGYAHLIRGLCAQYDLGDRVRYLESGDLESLVAHARGIVTVNSTVGTVALAAARPVTALGSAIYDLPGLCFQGPLDDFWRAGSPPDAALFAAFQRTVMHTTQINGGLYAPAAIDIAVAQLLPALRRERSPLETLIATGA